MTTNRITRRDRILADAAAVADALDGPWTIATSIWLAELVLLGPGVERLFVTPSPERPWGYTLWLDVPRGITGWRWDVSKHVVPRFTVGTPAAEVAAHIEEHVLRPFRDELAEALAAKERRAQARARQQEAGTALAAALGVVDPTAFTTSRPFRYEITDTIDARIQLSGDRGRVELCISLPVDEAAGVMSGALRSFAQSIRSGDIPSTATGS